MEELLHYVWKHKLFPLAPLTTTDGKSVEVVDVGLHNRHAGPDFFNAKVRIDGTLWVGNVEIHDKASDWFVHGHDRDARYDNVVLHVVDIADVVVRTSQGTTPPQMVLRVPDRVRDHYQELLAAEDYPPCHAVISSLPRLTVCSWLSALQTERLEQKTEAISDRVKACDGSWEAAYFVTLARNFGFGVNGDIFELWARSIPLGSVGHHRDDLFQVEAFFLGQAGLLDSAVLPPRCREAADEDTYFQRLRSEYAYLARKFSLRPIDGHLWRFLRLRPQNFPTIRIVQLARLYHEGRAGLSRLVDCASLHQVAELLATSVTPYWETHYLFGLESRRSEKRLSASSIALLTINTAVPMLFAYGRHKGDEKLCDRAFDLLEALSAEKNHIVETWKKVGLKAQTAGDSQALIQLKRAYCDRKECLRCRFGYEYLKKTDHDKNR